jgi:trigger factor
MNINVENLEKLERRITLNLSAQEVQDAVKSRLQKLAKDVKADGFRPGKVPMSVVEGRYGDSVQYEVLNEKLGQAFAQAVKHVDLRVAGNPRISPKPDAGKNEWVFDATFEVYPEIALPDLSQLKLERVTCDVTEDAIDKTIDFLRKQRRTYVQRSVGDSATEGDRVTIDFSGKIDGEPFQGGQATDFQFIIGEGQMLGQFDQAVRGMKAGDNKTFPLLFPESYHGKEVAGKEADFLVTMKKIEVVNLPEITDEFATAMGASDGTVAGLRVDARRNLEQEVKYRILRTNKSAVMDVLGQSAVFELPKSLVEQETQRLVENARRDLQQRGVKDVDSVPLPLELLQPEGEKRVRLGLILGELVQAHQLNAKPEQLQAHIQELARSYQNPAEVVGWYLSDRQRMAEVESMVLESNVTDFVLSKAEVTEKVISFDELMSI